MSYLDVNCDMGESYGRFSIGNDKDIMPYISSCNIACGFHGGDPMTIETTIRLALEHKVKVGAHPSYPDLMGFGRREMNIHPDELKSALLFQISALKGMTEALGGKLHHVKPHGALYNAACHDEMIAAVICQCIRSIDPELKVYGTGDSWRGIAEQIGLAFYNEIFADRRYNDDLTLVSRNQPEAIIKKQSDLERHVGNIINDNMVETISGKRIKIKADTLCIHGDEPGAQKLAKQIKIQLDEAGVKLNSIFK